VILTALLIIAALHAGDVDLSRLTPVEVKDRGEAAFAEGVRHRDDPDAARPHFRAAAACYSELRRRGARNATVYRNLGNAYLLAGDLPQAILSYRRGLQLAPGDRNLDTGLEAARERVSYPAGSRLGRPGPAGQASVLARVGGTWLVGGGALLYVGACVGFTRWLMTRRGGLLVAALVALFGAGFLTLLSVREASTVATGPLVVIAEDGVLLRRGDSLSYPPRYETPVNRGVEGHMLTARGNWLQIELSGGETGWVMREYVLVDEEED
jgi:tetratricopeptide (TPR) repeat protein